MPQNLRRFIPLIGWSVGFFAIDLVGEVRRVEARPRYQKVWREVYPDKDVSNAKCAICHVGEKKTSHTEYGEAVKEALGTKRVMDEDAIRAALKKLKASCPVRSREQSESHD
jgi:hypothetical protein